MGCIKIIFRRISVYFSLFVSLLLPAVSQGQPPLSVMTLMYSDNASMTNSKLLDAAHVTHDIFIFAQITNSAVSKVDFTITNAPASDITSSSTSPGLLVPSILEFTNYDFYDNPTDPLNPIIFDINNLTSDGTHTLTASATDSSGTVISATATFSSLRPSTFLPPIIDLILSNNTPIVNITAEPVGDYEEGTSVTLTATVVDSDAATGTDISTYNHSWEITPIDGGPTIVLDSQIDGATASTTFVAPTFHFTSYQYTVKLSVTDTEGGIGTDEKVITIINKNVAPIAKHGVLILEPTETSKAIPLIELITDADEHHSVNLASVTNLNTNFGAIQLDTAIFTRAADAQGKATITYTATDNDTSSPSASNEANLIVFVSAAGNTAPTEATLVQPASGVYIDASNSGVRYEWEPSADPADNDSINYELFICQDPVVTTCAPITLDKDSMEIVFTENTSVMIAFGSGGFGIALLGLVGGNRRRKILQAALLVGIAIIINACSDTVNEVTKNSNKIPPLEGNNNITYVVANLNADTDYYWQVYATDSQGGVTISPARMFTTKFP